MRLSWLASKQAGKPANRQASKRVGKHACARGKPECPVCRYGFPLDLVGRGGARPMRLDKGDKMGSWFARFPRNDRLCCNHEAHVLLDNLGNIDCVRA